MAVLSRFPFASTQSRTNETYSIGEEKDIPVARGFIDLTIKVNPDTTLHLMTAHLKSKVFHELGQTEMRRNEARLLGKLVRQTLKDDPDANLLVVGDLNDYPESRAVREVIGIGTPLLTDLRPTDEVGDSWTYYRSSRDEYSRIDYMLASERLRQKLVPPKTRAVRHPSMNTASDHRPLIAVFDAGN
jgi:endonuclease/exonuclease/phosphatase family metal-dependent hydrolase